MKAKHGQSAFLFVVRRRIELTGKQFTVASTGRTEIEFKSFTYTSTDAYYGQIPI